MDKYILIVTQNSWGDHTSDVYVKESINPKEAISSVIHTYKKDGYDEIDIDSAMSKYKSIGTEKSNGSVSLIHLFISGADTIEFEAYKIYENEPTVRQLH